MISDQELLKLEQDRQDESDFVLHNINLQTTLLKYGDVYIVGAKAMGLMVAKDIDISVVVDKINYDAWKMLVGELMTTPKVRKVTAIDYYNYDEANNYTPEKGQKFSLYIEMDTLPEKVNDKYDTWSCQIHLLERTTFDPNIVNSIKGKLAPNKRLTILRIKHWANELNKKLLEKSGGHFKIQSTDIYPLVLDGNVMSIENFLEQYPSKVPSRFRQLFQDEVQNLKYSDTRGRVN